MTKKSNSWLWMLTLGGLLGALGASWLAPKTISWYFETPVNTAFNCTAPVDWALKKLQLAQLIGIAAGSVAGLVLYFLIGRRKRASDLDSL